MAFNMLVSLYTSRVVLDSLGVDDYGVYNVVGGFVGLFSMISGSLAAAISRFLTFELGRGETPKLNNVFCTSVIIQFIIAAIVLVFSETVGLWFVNTQLVIPPTRLAAAHVAYQCSIATFIIGILSTPYNAVVVAHEKMSFFAIMSVSISIAKLIIAISLSLVSSDRLIFYAVLIAVIALVDRIVYGVYCSRNFEETHFHFCFERSLIAKIFGFAGWNSFGVVSSLLMTQGVNILVNIFFGLTCNAARGIATQVESAIGQLSSNFTLALNPQITKEYAKGNSHRTLQLVYSGSKLSFLLMLLVSLPILFETETILGLWLVSTPDFAVLFARLAILVSLLSIVSQTLVSAMLATGKIRNYQIVVGGLGLLIYPIVWALYKLGFPVYVSYVVHFLIFVVQLATRLVMLRKMIGLDPLYFIRHVLLKDVEVVALSIVLPIAITVCIEPSVPRFILTTLTAIISTIISAYFVGLSPQEKNIVLDLAGNMFKRLSK